MKCIDFVLRHWNEVLDPVLQRKWLFVQVIIFRLEVLRCYVDQGVGLLKLRSLISP